MKKLSDVFGSLKKKKNILFAAALLACSPMATQADGFTASGLFSNNYGTNVSLDSGTGAIALNSSPIFTLDVNYSPGDVSSMSSNSYYVDNTQWHLTLEKNGNVYEQDITGGMQILIDNDGVSDSKILAQMDASGIDGSDGVTSLVFSFDPGSFSNTNFSNFENIISLFSIKNTAVYSINTANGIGISGDISVIPEPSSLMLVSSVLGAGVALRALRKRSTKKPSLEIA